MLGVGVRQQATAGPEWVEVVARVPLRHCDVVEAVQDPPDHRVVCHDMLPVRDGRVDVPIVEVADVDVHIRSVRVADRRVTGLDRVNGLEVRRLDIDRDVEVGTPKLVDPGADRMLLVKRLERPTGRDAGRRTAYRAQPPVCPIGRKRVSRRRRPLERRQRERPDVQTEPARVGDRRVGDPRVDPHRLVFGARRDDRVVQRPRVSPAGGRIPVHDEGRARCGADDEHFGADEDRCACAGARAGGHVHPA